MLKFKNALLAMMVLATIGFISCKNDDSNGGSEPLNWNNTYWGTMSLMGKDYPIAVTLTDTTFSWAAGNYKNGEKTTYSFVTKGTDADGNSVFKGYSSEANKTANKPSATVTSKANKFYFDVPAMKAMLNYKSTEIAVGGAYDERFTAYKNFYGTYNGTLMMMGNPFKTKVVIAENSLKYSSPDMPAMQGNYTNVVWEVTSNGKGSAAKTSWTLTTYANSDTNKTNPKSRFYVSESGTYKWSVLAMPGAPTVDPLTKE
ncbi:hypothetical protein [Treponema pectinovorum]|uniref:hypothetical protein n=1 Tax=Treponema pectinovorum TaxID=164 RepID=UPI0011C8EED9|nr:hypothetical protein [Treponema pectinovorum]